MGRWILGWQFSGLFKCGRPKKRNSRGPAPRHFFHLHFVLRTHYTATRVENNSWLFDHISNYIIRTLSLHTLGLTPDFSYTVAFFKQSNDSSPSALSHLQVNRNDKCSAQDQAMARYYVPPTNEATGDVASLHRWVAACLPPLADVHLLDISKSPRGRSKPRKQSVCRYLWSAGCSFADFFRGYGTGYLGAREDSPSNMGCNC